MAKITITIEDTDKGPVKGSVRFEPAINLSGEMTGTPALVLASKLLDVMVREAATQPQQAQSPTEPQQQGAT